MKKTIRTIQQPTEEQARQLAALDAMRDEDIDLSDIPEQGGRVGWVRGAMYRPVMKAISIRLAAPDLALARQLALRKGVPYQTYIKSLLHDALDRERKGEQL
jgi:predicted DNA binding CopG/RHH family protein